MTQEHEAIAEALESAMADVLSGFNQSAMGDPSFEPARDYAIGEIGEVNGFFDLYAAASGGFEPSAARAWLDRDHAQMCEAFEAEHGRPWDCDDEESQDWESSWQQEGPAIWLTIVAYTDGTFLAQMSDANGYNQNAAWLSVKCDTLKEAVAALLEA